MEEGFPNAEGCPKADVCDCADAPPSPDGWPKADICGCAGAVPSPDGWPKAVLRPNVEEGAANAPGAGPAFGVEFVFCWPNGEGWLGAIGWLKDEPWLGVAFALPSMMSKMLGCSFLPSITYLAAPCGSFNAASVCCTHSAHRLEASCTASLSFPAAASS